MAKVKVKFEKERETKNKVVFREKGKGEEVIGGLYVSKGTAGDNESVTVTLDFGSEE